jgi:hypothetical protein
VCFSRRGAPASVAPFSVEWAPVPVETGLFLPRAGEFPSSFAYSLPASSFNSSPFQAKSVRTLVKSARPGRRSAHSETRAPARISPDGGLPLRHACDNFSCRIRSMESRNVAEIAGSGRTPAHRPVAAGRCFTVRWNEWERARLGHRSTMARQRGRASHAAQSSIMAEGLEPSTRSGFRSLVGSSRYRRTCRRIACRVGSGERHPPDHAGWPHETGRGRARGTISE